MDKMQSTNFIDARRFTFAPFPHPLHPDYVGDSGVMEFAVSKTDAHEQYVVKRGSEYPDVAANEFMYHKVADALGLYTQDVFLINGRRDYHRSAAIRYVPNAIQFNLKTSSNENYIAFFEFEALYTILSESDSDEHYLDGHGKIFKLDNATSFLVDPFLVMQFDGDPRGNIFPRNFRSILTSTDYNEYSISYKTILSKHDCTAEKAYLSVFRRFCKFDETVLSEAYTALKKQYPTVLVHYYEYFIRNRKDRCRKFLAEIGEYAED
jgi:hypothetical protein